MNKKFLSAILFGALMVTSTGTFVSCKDYDDDIENLQGQISANTTAIAELKALIGDGNYVTSVTVSGQNLVVNTKNGSTTVALPACEGGGSLAEVKGNQLFIDGEATGLYGESVKIVDGEWALLQEDGTYKSTGIAVSGVTVTGDEQNGYVLTVTDAEGNATVIELPTAASAITSISVAPYAALVGDETDEPAIDVDYAWFNVTKATFNYNKSKRTEPEYATWKGERELPSDESVVYSPTTSLQVRINPIEVPADNVTFYLTNTKNHTLSKIALSASTTQKSWNGPIGITGINGRSVTNNGLWTLGMSQYILDKDAAAAFEKNLADGGAVNLEDNTKTIANSAAFAVNANDKARSEYNVAVSRNKAGDLSQLYIPSLYDYVDYSVEKLSDGKATNIVVNVGQTYTVAPFQSGLLYDLYFEAASETVIETYGLEFDNLNRTFKVTKRPDVVTEANAFTLTVHTLDIWGCIRKGHYKVTLSDVIGASVTYPAVEHNLAKLADSDGSNDNFTANISELKTALGEDWSQWANSVSLKNTSVAVYTSAGLEGWSWVADVTDKSTNGLTYGLMTASHAAAKNADDFSYIKLNVGNSDNKTFKVDTQYYVKVSFKNKNNGAINHVVIPVMFTAPTVADQFALKSGYVVDNVVNAYYYNYDATKNAEHNRKIGRTVELKHYFDKWDATAELTLDAKTVLATLSDGTELHADDLAVFRGKNDAAVTTSTIATETAYLRLVQGYALGDGTNREIGYGKELAINAWNEDYKGWLYKEDAQKGYDFSIKLMSPIFEGNITPATGSTIDVTANGEAGFAITKSMITLTDYNQNEYNVVPNVDKAQPTNKKDNTVDAWKDDQLVNVWVTKDNNNTYIKKFELRAQKDATETTEEVPGAIMVYADPLPNSQATSMNVNVTDIWGYNKTQEVSVTIVKK